MDRFELQVLYHYTANGTTQIALIPQYSVPPAETWSIDFLGIDLKSKSLLFIEVCSAQTPSAKFVNKLMRRKEWIPIVRKRLIEETRVIDETWRHMTVAFVIDRKVEWLRGRLGNPSDVKVVPLSNCFPLWLTAKEKLACGQPRVEP
jgi:hypothetical protein